MISNDILIYTATFWFFVAIAIAIAQEPAQEKNGCAASAYQAERYGFDLQENLDACM